MQISEALDKVGGAYVPGTVAFYAKQSPDPWQSAHDELERIAGRFDEDIVGPTCDAFVSRCLELIEHFKRIGIPQKNVMPVDAFAMGDYQRVRSWQSRKFKECITCGSKEGLRLVAVSGSTEVKIACAAHASGVT